jgi:hypothetical protein
MLEVIASFGNIAKTDTCHKICPNNWTTRFWQQRQSFKDSLRTETQKVETCFLVSTCLPTLNVSTIQHIPSQYSRRRHQLKL